MNPSFRSVRSSIYRAAAVSYRPLPEHAAQYQAYKDAVNQIEQDYLANTAEARDIYVRATSDATEACRAAKAAALAAYHRTPAYKAFCAHRDGAPPPMVQAPAPVAAPPAKLSASTERIVAYISDEPGCTRGELISALGISYQVVYRAVHRALEAGTLVEQAVGPDQGMKDRLLFIKRSDDSV